MRGIYEGGCIRIQRICPDCLRGSANARETDTQHFGFVVKKQKRKREGFTYQLYAAMTDLPNQYHPPNPYRPSYVDA
jgi:hypothetical protein